MNKHFANLLTLFISLVLIALVLEIAIRMVKIAYEPQYDNYVKITQPSINSGIEYELIPNYQGQAFGGYVSVNSFGFRG